MAIMVSNSGGGGDFSPVPAGMHIAVCDMVVDLGNQKTTFQGEESVKPQVYIRWQIPAERIEWTDANGEKHEGPMVIGKTYTASLGEKANLRKDLESWRGRSFTEDELKGFDVSKLLMVPASISVVHKAGSNGKTYANIGGIGGIPKGMEKPRVEGEPVLYDDETTSTFDKLPKWIKEKLDARVSDVEANKARDPDAWRSEMSNGRDDDLDDDVPF